MYSILNETIYKNTIVNNWKDGPKLNLLKVVSGEPGESTCEYTKDSDKANS